MVIDFKIGRHRCAANIHYTFVPGELGDYYNPTIKPEIVINAVEILDFCVVNQYLLGLKWFKKHPGWRAWLESKVFEIVDDPESDEYQRILCANTNG